MVKLRDKSPPLPPTKQIINLTSPAPTSPILAPDEIIVRATRVENPREKEAIVVPSPTISELSSLTSQSEDDTQQMPAIADTLSGFVIPGPY